MGCATLSADATIMMVAMFVTLAVVVFVSALILARNRPAAR